LAKKLRIETTVEMLILEAFWRAFAKFCMAMAIDPANSHSEKIRNSTI
jgi:hypothetical protein